MKNTIFLISMLSSLCSLAAADQSGKLKGSAQIAIKSLNEVNTPLCNNCVDNPVEASNPICSSITDNFCDKLWSKEAEGNIKTFDGQIMAGKSTKSEMALQALYNDRVFVSSLSKLPKDAQKHLTLPLKKLAKILDQENSSSKWNRDYSQVKTEISNAIEDLTDERYDKLGLTKAADFKKWNNEEALTYSEVSRELSDQITKAKYSNHPNWKRVESAYDKAKSHLIGSISKLKIPKEKQDEMINKLLSVKLSLPLLDPTKAGSESCANTQVNAFYSPVTNYFTLCAGYFNSYQSESSLIFVIAHELGHAIDSERQANDKWKRESDIAKKLSLLKNTSKQSYSCDEWNKMNKDVLKTPTKYELITSPLDNLYECLRGDIQLEKIEFDKLLDVVKQQIKMQTGAYADYKTFSTLLSKNNDESKDGKNEYYYDPAKLIQKMIGYRETTQSREANAAEIFMQNFYCALEDNGLTKDSFETASKEVRSKLLEHSIEQTTRIQAASLINRYEYCGKNCGGLTSYDMSFDISEKMADWFANKAVPSYLKDLPVQNREEASALSTSLFCTKKNTTNELTLAEKKFSLESHPDDRHRRVSLYTPETAAVLSCNIQTGDEGDAKCAP